MTKNSITRLFAGAIAFVLFLTAGSRPAQAAVYDNAGFFSDQAKTEAARNIADLEKRYKKDLVIETFKEIPDDIKKGVDLQDKAATTRMFDQWAMKQARQLKVNGVYLLLSKEPAHLQAVVGNDTQLKAFTLRDRDTLVTLMVAKLKQKSNDAALLDGVNFVSATMAGHAGVNRTSATPVRNTSAPAHVSGGERSSGMGAWIIVAVIGFIAMIIIIGIIRALFRGGSPGMGGGAAPGGGGFMSSLLGGMFGAAAGMWLYDQFSGHNNSSDAGSDLSSRQNDGFSGQDSDYSSSGDDFGGGGDSGGGGGDFGGGGDSGGGGGGDF